MKETKKQLRKSLIRQINFNNKLRFQEELNQESKKKLKKEFTSKWEIKDEIRKEKIMTNLLMGELFKNLGALKDATYEKLDIYSITSRYDEFNNKIMSSNLEAVGIFEETISEWRTDYILNDQRRRLLTSLTLIEGIMNRLIGFNRRRHESNFRHYWTQFFEKIKDDVFPQTVPFIVYKVIDLYFNYRNPIVHVETLSIVSDELNQEIDTRKYITEENIVGIESLSFTLLKLNPNELIEGISYLEKANRNVLRGNRT